MATHLLEYDDPSQQHPMRFPFPFFLLIALLAPLCSADQLSEAIDMPELSTTTGGNGTITAQSATTHDGVDAVELSTIANQNEFWFQTTIEGPATVSFYYKFSPDRISNWAGFYIDGSQQMQDHFGYYVGTRYGFNWTRHEYEILSEGSHTLKWSVRHGYYVDDDTKAWVDELVVNRAPIIMEQPSPVNVDEGEPIELSIDVNLPEKVTYQWRQNGEPISGETASTLTIDSDQVSSTGVYDVAVSNAYGVTYSTPVDVFVFSQFGEAIEQPDLEWHTSGIGWSPQSATSHDSVDSLELDSRETPKEIWFETSINGPFALSYWWKLEKEIDGDKIELEVNGTPVELYSGNGDWTEANYETSQVGAHDVRWTFTPDPSTDKDYNTFGWVDELDIEYIPSIVAPPQDVAVDEGDPVTLEVTAVAETAIAYQWYHDGQLIAGETSSQLSIAESSLGDAGSYHVVASTGSRSVESETATVQVLRGFSEAVELSGIDWVRSVPSWYAQTDETHDGVDALETVLNNGSEKSSLALKIEGPFEFSFWWRQSMANSAEEIRFFVDGEVVASKRGDSSWSQETYTGLESRSYTLAWEYQKHYAGSSSAAYLDEFQLSQAPIITEQPESWYFAEGEDVTFSIQAVSHSPVSYQWRKDGVDIEGETASSLAFSNVQAEALGEYDVVLTATEGETISDSFEIMDTESFGKSVDQPNLVWKTNGDEQWLIGSNATDGSRSSLKSGDISGNGTTWLSTVVEGESELSFNWKASTEACCDRLKLYLDGALIGELRGEEDWTSFSYSIPAGLHELKWEYSKDEKDDAGQDSVWIDSVQLAPIVTGLTSDLSLFEGQDLHLSVSVAGDFDLSFAWSRNGEAIEGANAAEFDKTGILRDEAGDYRVLVTSDFGHALSAPVSVEVVDFGAAIGQPDQNWDFSAPTWTISEDFEGRTVALAESLSANEQRWFEHKIEGSATVEFDWYLSTDDGDELQVFVDGIQQSLSAPSESWTKAQFEVPGDGEHSLRWGFAGSAAETGSADFAAIDSIEIDQTPSILSQPHQIVVEESHTLEFEVVSEARGTLSYQWFQDEVAIPSATTATFTIDNASADHAGTYQLSLSTKHDTVLSAPIDVIVSEPLASGLDVEDLEIISGTPQRWYTDKAFGSDGEDSVSVVALEVNETAEFSFERTGPFSLSFDYWMGSVEGEDHELLVRIDGENELRFSESDNWKNVEITFPYSGAHELSFLTTRQSESATAPEVWIDNLRVAPLSAVETDSALWVLESGGSAAGYENIGSIQDPDFDGLANLLEFWLQSAPFDFDDLIRFEISNSEDATRARVGIEIADTMLERFEIEVEASSELGTWERIQSTKTYEEGTLWLAIDSEITEGSRFFRLLVRDVAP
ncbi:immunoglobulin domain-containing protein [Pelagicoccus sp. SDUM812003]|uniref:immunoglobulin domain-containing protein n=1 Tax=Pelagicoccus sp. SDUM812003 TaxID=3041267 RepID=UPI00280D7F2B|nr:immunoglobulin domain-containing protein [Pelagicoccus sp. SDUM812003]MDQ8205387.1 immunoglobulin domain-containing protein [Pelagicoccus sp. SDUM812003]